MATLEGVFMASDADDSASTELSHLGQVAVSHHGRGVAVVTLRGEHDLSTRPVLAQALQLAAAHSNVVVDLSECAFIDSTAINEFIKSSRHVQASGERFMLVIPPEQAHVARVARMVQLAEIFEVHESKDAAFASLANQSRRNVPQRGSSAAGGGWPVLHESHERALPPHRTHRDRPR
jgi:anti-anti-sigma factor